MQISTDAIKELREQTSAGLMECKRALEECEGDLEGAAAKLRERGYAIAQKKEDRVARQGLVECYVHTGGRIGALVEVNCESDFVARTPEFKDLAHDLAMQVVASSPCYVTREDSDSGEEVADEDCLLLQPYIKDPSKTVGDLLAETVASVRESIKVKRFVRFELGLDEQDE
jgi:elongation factor Ts